jgi:hypothetical protein
MEAAGGADGQTTGGEQGDLGKTEKSKVKILKQKGLLRG